MIYGESVAQALQTRKVWRDFEYVDRGSKVTPRIDYIHRRTDDLDFYFVSNQRNEPSRVRVWLRTEKSRQPEIWHPESGAMAPAVFWQRGEDGRCGVDLNLGPAESVFVTFRRQAVQARLSGYAELRRDDESHSPLDLTHVVSKDGTLRLRALAPGRYTLAGHDGTKTECHVRNLPAAKDISPGWRVSFPTTQGSVETQLSPLADWTSSANDAIKHFSGTATYSRNVDIDASALPADAIVQLDPGEVHVIAQVEVNGKDCGVWWKPPFTGDIASALKPGRNLITVRVTNLWGNRLIGDAKLAGITKRARDAAFRRVPLSPPPAFAVERTGRFGTDLRRGAGIS